MFEKLFEKFNKKITKADKTKEELEVEFDKIKVEYAQIATSQLYNLFSEYFLAKIEINRDLIDHKNPLIGGDRIKILELQSENRVMRGFIEDVEGMRKMVEQEQEEKS